MKENNFMFPRYSMTDNCTTDEQDSITMNHLIRTLQSVTDFGVFPSPTLLHKVIKAMIFDTQLGGAIRNEAFGYCYDVVSFFHPPVNADTRKFYLQALIGRMDFEWVSFSFKVQYM